MKISKADPGGAPARIARSLTLELVRVTERAAMAWAARGLRSILGASA